MNFLYSNHLLFDCLSATYMLPNPLYIFTLLRPYRSLTLMVSAITALLLESGKLRFAWNWDSSVHVLIILQYQISSTQENYWKIEIRNLKWTGMGKRTVLTQRTCKHIAILRMTVYPFNPSFTGSFPMLHTSQWRSPLQCGGRNQE